MSTAIETRPISEKIQTVIRRFVTSGPLSLDEWLTVCAELIAGGCTHREFGAIAPFNRNALLSASDALFKLGPMVQAGDQRARAMVKFLKTATSTPGRCEFLLGQLDGTEWALEQHAAGAFPGLDVNLLASDRDMNRVQVRYYLDGGL